MSLTAAGALAQERAPEAPAATIVEQVTVNVVNIDVHVSDRRGRPISNLSVEDFEVFEDGERMEIANFRAASSRTDRVRDGREWVESADLEELAGAEPAPPRLVALYIDRYWTRLGNLRRIESNLMAFLGGPGELPGEHRFLLATGDPDLNIRVPFTTDPGELVAALQTLKTERHGDNDGLRRRALRRIRDEYENCALAEGNQWVECEPCQDLWEGFLGTVNEYAAETQLRAGASFSALGELVTALGGLPGPKALIYFSDGLPQMPGAAMYHFLGEVCPERQLETDRRQFERDQTTAFNRFSAFSNANRVTIYPVDAGGLRSSSSVDASIGGPVGADGGGGAGGLRLANVLAPSNQNDRLRVDNLQASLSLFADETGGRAVFNENRPQRVLEEVAADFGSFYSLGYAAPPERRYAIRQIEVRLTEPKKGWRVRYRRSYVLKSEEQRLADRLYAALRLGEQDNPLDADVTFGAGSAASGSKQITVPVEVHVPMSAVTLAPGPSGPAGTVRIFLIAGDENGRRTAMRQKTLTVTEAQLSGERQEALVVVNVDLPAGEFDIAVGIRDETTGRTSYLVRDVPRP